MRELRYRLYCYLHYIIKTILGKNTMTSGNILDVASIKIGVNNNCTEFWRKFIESSAISSGKEHEGSLYAGYILEKEEWCLPSWIWTNAAIIRMYCITGNVETAKSLAYILASQQLKCGGWIVRNDYDKKGAIPMLAPNDSAYIANNAFLSLYFITNDKTYLNIAKHCAEWIIETARADDMVYVGYNMRDCIWDKSCVIVDVGFTGSLFSRLYEITKEVKYKEFLEKFIKRYIELFYIPSQNGFATSINTNNKQQGGMFGRGQAWALEGLIPAYKVLKDDYIKIIIDSTINNLIKAQLKNGGWAYNLSKPLLGEDCKAVSVIAKNMMEWYTFCHDEKIKNSAEKALNWCKKHTANAGEAKGGIFSFSMEGGIVKNLYTSCAFVYASAYAIELELMLKK